MDEHEVIERLFTEPHRVRPVAAEMYIDSIPGMLEPPVGAWRYFCRLPLSGRISWIAYVLFVWGGYAFSARTRAGSRLPTRY